MVKQASVASPLDSLLRAFDPAAAANVMSDRQVQAESGGRQFDKSGKPLVGKYPDGTEPPAGKKAYGVGQIQIGTARNTATAHGIPWDENKLLNDAAYNRQLADLHMSDLKKHYGGDETLAVAAYHQGQSTVDRALATHGRANFTKGIGPGGRDYVAKVTGEKSVGSATTAAGVRANMDPAAATAAELKNMGTPRTYEVADPNAKGKELGPEATAMESAHGDVLASARAALASTVIATQDVKQDSVEAGTEIAGVQANLLTQDTGYKNKLQELLAERRRIASRKQEIRGMNPFSRLFKGLTSPAYNEVELKEAELTNNENLSLLAEDYKLTQEADSRFINHRKEKLATDVGLATADADMLNVNHAATIKVATAAAGVLGATLQTIQTQSSLDSVKAKLRDDILTTTSESALAVAESEAQKNGGRTLINGVEISGAEITKAREGMRNSRLQSRLADLAAQRGDLELQDYTEEKAIEVLTPAQKVAAMAAGGVINGTQLNPTKLQASIAKDQQVTANQVAASLIPDSVNDYKQAAGQFSDLIPVDVERVGSFGATNNSDFRAYLAQASEVAARHKKAIGVANGSPGGMAAIVGPLQKELQELAAQRTKAIESVAKQWANGNEKVAGLAKTYLTGGTVNQSDAVQALVLQARGRMGGAQDISPAGLATRNEVKRIINEWDSQHAGKKPDDNGLVQRITGILESRRGQFIVDTVHGSAPTIARKVQVNGAPHPLSQIPDRDFQAASLAADNQGAIAFAKANGIQVGPGMSVGQIQAAANKLGIPNVEAQIASAQYQSFFTVLDQQFSKPGFDATQAYVDLLNRQEFQNISGEMSRGTGAKDKFGDFLVTSALGNSGAAEVYVRTQNMKNAYNAWRSNKMAALTNTNVAMTPATQLKQFATGIEGVTPQEIDILSKELAKTTANYQPPHGPLNRKAQVDRMNMIDQFLVHNKFENPQLESIRKRVVKDWPTIVTHFNRFLGPDPE